MTINLFSVRYSFLLFLCLIIACAAPEPVFYVSPQGDDQQAGTQEQPFASLERARQAVQAAIAGGAQGPFRIQLTSGLHRISRPLAFRAEDFGQAGNELRIAAEPGETVVVSGGIPLENWQQQDENIWTLQLPDSLQRLRQIRELFIDGKRAIRARFPNEGYLRVKQVAEDRRTGFYFEKGDFILPETVQHTELVLLHDWSITRIPIQSIDESQDKLTAVDSIGAKVLDFFNLDHWEQQPRYFLENDRRFLDQDYEWCFVPDDHRFYLQLPAGLNPAELEISMPLSEGLLVLEGTAAEPVKNIHISGITFRHSAWQIPELGYGGIQAAQFDPRPKGDGSWIIVPAAISARYADGCSLQDCRFEHLGGSGLWFGEGCTNNTISGCSFTDISGNGVMLGEGNQRKAGNEPWWQVVPEQVAKNNTVSDCEIWDCGVQFFGSVGIWCGIIEGTSLIRNKIHDLPYTGISIGWLWSPEPTPARNNVLAGNHIHHIMQKLSDGGGIYMLGLQPESRISNNLIHDVIVNAGRAESNGMFLDEGTTQVLVEDNVVYNIAKSPIRFHRATNNVMRNNALFCRDSTAPFAYNRTDTALIQRIDNQVYHSFDPEYAAALEAATNAWKPVRDE